MKRSSILFLSGLICGGAIIGAVAFNSPNPSDALVAVQNTGKLQYKWYVPDLPKTASFAGEVVPLDRWEVRERLDRELLVNYYLHGSLLYILKLTTRYFPMIEARLRANGVPDDFKY